MHLPAARRPRNAARKADRSAPGRKPETRQADDRSPRLTLSEAGLAALLTKLKNSCGAGGTVEDGLIEIQGNQLDRIRNVLTALGYKVKG